MMRPQLLPLHPTKKAHHSQAPIPFPHTHTIQHSANLLFHPQFGQQRHLLTQEGQKREGKNTKNEQKKKRKSEKRGKAGKAALQWGGMYYAGKGEEGMRERVFFSSSSYSLWLREKKEHYQMNFPCDGDDGGDGYRYCLELSSQHRSSQT